MVFGNLGDSSATGVAFTRDAGTGEDLFNGEFLVNAQGEDVVAGIRTPQQVSLVGSRRWAELALVSEDERRSQVPVAGRADAGDLPAAAARRDHAGEPLQGHAGPGVHDPGGQAVDAADAQRQAHRRGDGAHRDGDAAAGHDRREDGAAARCARPAERPAAPDLRPQCAEGARRSSRAACRRRPARPAGRSCSSPTRPRSGSSRARP